MLRSMSLGAHEFGERAEMEKVMEYKVATEQVVENLKTSYEQKVNEAVARHNALEVRSRSSKSTWRM